MRYPGWLKKKVPKGANNVKIREIMGDDSLHTVCESALCPNRGECFEKGTVTFMILGDRCTRDCTFCAVEPHPRLTPLPLQQAREGCSIGVDSDEPKKIAEQVKKLGLKHVVITSVTRDDLEDGGAEHFARVIKEINASPRPSPPSGEGRGEATIEVLTSDLQGNKKALKKVLDADPDVFNHNVETIERLYPEVRPQADFRQSLGVLKYAKEYSEKQTNNERRQWPLSPFTYQPMLTKSGFMLGLGETEEEIKELLQILKENGVDVVTIGQYIAPSKEHYPVHEFIHPDKFDEYKKYGEEVVGLRQVFAAPFVRSSYQAEEIFSKAQG